MTFINIVIAMILIVGIISVLLARKITDPIWAIIESVKEIGRGNLDYRVEVKTGDELEELARSINWMAESLKALQAIWPTAKGCSVSWKSPGAPSAAFCLAGPR